MFHLPPSEEIEPMKMEPGYYETLSKLIDMNNRILELNEKIFAVLNTVPRLVIRSERDGLTTKQELRNQQETDKG